MIFAGTPHRGSNKAAWASIATNLAKLVRKDHNDRVVDALCRGSETLERLEHSFAGVSVNLNIFSFVEDMPMATIGKASRKARYLCHSSAERHHQVVDDDSASLGFPNERKICIHANHVDMVKFNNRQDLGYRRMSGAIAELMELPYADDCSHGQIRRTTRCTQTWCKIIRSNLSRCLAHVSDGFKSK